MHCAEPLVAEWIWIDHQSRSGAFLTFQSSSLSEPQWQTHAGKLQTPHQINELPHLLHSTVQLGNIACKCHSCSRLRFSALHSNHILSCKFVSCSWRLGGWGERRWGCSGWANGNSGGEKTRKKCVKRRESDRGRQRRVESAVIRQVSQWFNPNTVLRYVVAGYLLLSRFLLISPFSPLLLSASPSLALNNTVWEMVPTYWGDVSRRLWEHHRTYPNDTWAYSCVHASSVISVSLVSATLSG